MLVVLVQQSVHPRGRLFKLRFTFIAICGFLAHSRHILQQLFVVLQRVVVPNEERHRFPIFAGVVYETKVEPRVLGLRIQPLKKELLVRPFELFFIFFRKNPGSRLVVGSRCNRRRGMGTD